VVSYRPINVETACVTDFSWWTERARRARVQFSRLRGFYPRECGAVLLFERGYPAQRPRAGRGLSPVTV